VLDCLHPSAGRRRTAVQGADDVDHVGNLIRPDATYPASLHEDREGGIDRRRHVDR